ncbi:MAG: substrate-binding and VWA domain-containing protein, partial [Sporichthyaceae bacterium]|nr:substrate-binding and VWA domain-containing protein [Sporichthyaceae bacterium]
MLLVVVVAGGAVAYSSVAGCGDTTEISVAASPDIAPAVRTVAAEVDQKSGGLLGGRLLGKCTKITVIPVDSAEVATALAAGDAGRIGNPNVWIPDSSVWLGVVKASQENGDRVQSSASVASSPVVLAMVRPAAEQAGWPDKQLTWGELLANYSASPVKVGIADPTRSAATMLTFGGIRAALGTGEDATVQLVGAVRLLAQRVSGTTEELLGKLPQSLAELTQPTLGRVSAFPYSEQGVWQYNQTDPAVPLAAIYPGDGTPLLDYPFTTLVSDGTSAGQAEDKQDAARKLLEGMLGESGRQAVAAHGFRTEDGTAGAAIDPSSGVLAAAPAELQPPDSQAISDLQKLWGTVSLNARILTVIDVSGSMGEPVPGTGGKRRMDLAKEAVQSALPLLRDDTSVGLWTFSTELVGNRDYREIVPVGALGAVEGGQPRRTALAAAVGSLTWKVGGATGLYDTALAAYREVTEGFEPDKINVVVLLTDGRNEDPSGGISLASLTRALSAEFNPEQPVAIISIGFGDADAEALKAISDATHGQSYTTDDPALIRQVLLEAIATR